MENHHFYIFLLGKPSINGPFSMATGMLNNQRYIHIHSFFRGSRKEGEQNTLGSGISCQEIWTLQRLHKTNMKRAGNLHLRGGLSDSV